MQFHEMKTERLVVRRLKSTDAQVVSCYRSMPDVTKYQSSYSVPQAEKLIQEMSESDPSVKGKWFQFAIELASENLLVGDIGFLNTDENNKSWIGFTLNPHFWHRGYATEAVHAVLSYYKRLGISSIWASTDPKNENSMKLLRALGFTLVESKPNDMIFALHG